LVHEENCSLSIIASSFLPFDPHPHI
jgi:hypothetical protein